MSATADVSRMLQSLSQVTERRLNAARKGVGDFAEMWMTNAKAITPVEWGTLRRSGNVGPVQVNGWIITVALGFDTDYAAAVHERPPDVARHQPPTQWKFLEAPGKEMNPKFLPFMAARINGVG